MSAERKRPINHLADRIQTQLDRGNQAGIDADAALIQLAQIGGKDGQTVFQCLPIIIVAAETQRDTEWEMALIDAKIPAKKILKILGALDRITSNTGSTPTTSTPTAE